MTNEEKAKELANKWSTDGAYNRAKISAMEMADWKDQQFKEAVAQLRKWLYEHGKLDKLDLVEFDMEINKLWEEKK